MLSQPIITTLNHLLEQSGWASPRLVKFSARTARFTIAPLSFACTIQDDGTLHAASTEASADANLVIPPSLLPRLAMQDEAAFGQIRTSGDAALVEEILFLANNLRWDAAEDISRFTGDIAAERIVQFARQSQKAVRDTAGNLSQALAEYWTEERPVLAKAARISDFAQQVGRLHSQVERLEQRIRRLAES
jgi:ubiquinone biosynthesis accessory factor UbiJ